MRHGVGHGGTFGVWKGKPRLSRGFRVWSSGAVATASRFAGSQGRLRRRRGCVPLDDRCPLLRWRYSMSARFWDFEDTGEPDGGLDVSCTDILPGSSLDNIASADTHRGNVDLCGRYRCRSLEKSRLLARQSR
ncbi:hypothetical protein AB395_00001946 [Sinorhizobium fredii CCBAU 45436]|nr:hypothetical protein AB395_00001946 [Sinorhizobium fredii CCBAU 45436]